jgi:hypothetical protein
MLGFYPLLRHSLGTSGARSTKVQPVPVFSPPHFDVSSVFEHVLALSAPAVTFCRTCTEMKSAGKDGGSLLLDITLPAFCDASPASANSRRNADLQSVAEHLCDRF